MVFVSHCVNNTCIHIWHAQFVNLCLHMLCMSNIASVSRKGERAFYSILTFLSPFDISKTKTLVCAAIAEAINCCGILDGTSPFLHMVFNSTIMCT